MSAILLGNDVLHYEVLGRGRAVIFLHGWVGSWRYWIPMMQAASVSYRAYAIDLWGFGDTAKNKHYSLADQAEMIYEFMEKMGMIRAALVGHGLGASVATYFALQHPDYVDRIMAVNIPLDESMIAPRLRTASPVELADWLLVKTPDTEPARTDAPKTDPQAIQQSFAGLGEPVMKDIWRTIKTNCLMVHSANDPAVTAPRIDQVADLPGFTHSVLFEQSGHFPMLDESSKFNRLMTDFLALRSGESPQQLQLKEEWKRRVR